MPGAGGEVSGPEPHPVENERDAREQSPRGWGVKARAASRRPWDVPLPAWARSQEHIIPRGGLNGLSVFQSDQDPRQLGSQSLPGAVPRAGKGTLQGLVSSVCVSWPSRAGRSWWVRGAAHPPGDQREAAGEGPCGSEKE